jgi:sensor domain CHASE-containing protein
VAAGTHPRASERSYTSWDRARLSVVVPIGVIVAVAIVCIVVAVISSAKRADQVAVQHEKILFSRALASYGERVMREVKSVAVSERGNQNIRAKWDAEWVKTRVDHWLKTFFEHDHVFVFDGADKPLYPQFDSRAAAAAMPDM